MILDDQYETSLEDIVCNVKNFVRDLVPSANLMSEFNGNLIY